MAVLKKSNMSAVVRPASRGAFEHPVHDHFHGADYGAHMHHTPHFHEHHDEHHKESLWHHHYVQEFMRQSVWEKLTSVCTAALALTSVSIVALVLFLQIFG